MRGKEVMTREQSCPATDKRHRTCGQEKRNWWRNREKEAHQGFMGNQVIFFLFLG